MPKWVAGEITEAKARSALGGGGPEGMLAEMVVTAEEGVVHVPAHLSDEEAATLPCAAVTAWHALVGEGRAQGRRHGARARDRRRVDLRPAIGPTCTGRE